MRWSPPEKLSSSEKLIAARCRNRKLFVFLREWRHRIFDEDTQAQLREAYSPKMRGKEAVPPAQLAMAMVMQAAFDVPDHEVVTLTVDSKRWQMVLDCLGAEDAPFSQGTFFNFRERMIAHDLDKKLFERTIALAKETGAFSATTLRAAIDSSPIYGSGRVEDTFNLIGRAAFHVVRTAAKRLSRSVDDVAADAGIPLVVASSIKAGLDLDWDDVDARKTGLRVLFNQVESLLLWLEKELKSDLESPPLKDEVTTLMSLVDQDTEPDPSGGGRRITEGVAKGRRISVSDKDMRHGRKSKSQLINGYKGHIAFDVDGSGLILGVAVTPANRPEREACKELLEAIEQHGVLADLYIDRGYLGDDEIEARRARGMRVHCKPFPLRNNDLFTKDDFNLNVAAGTVTCPHDVVLPFRAGTVLHFPSERCAPCPKRAQCTRAKDGRGRSLSLHRSEDLLIELRAKKKTSQGRADLRARVAVEHGLAHVANNGGDQARYRGRRKTVFDRRRHAIIANLHAIERSPGR